MLLHPPVITSGFVCVYLCALWLVQAMKTWLGLLCVMLCLKVFAG